MTTDDYKIRVRQNAGSCGIAAALMIYFGFFSLLEPSGTDLFSRANWAFFHTVRIGGVAMAVLALWSLTGARLSLIVDAVVSIAIGVLLALTGVVMLIDGGGTLQSVLNVMFGWMFVSAGRANWGVYQLSTEPAEHTARPMANPTPAQQPPRQFVSDQAEAIATVPLAVADIKPVAPAAHIPATPEPEIEPTQDATPNETPGGFLESFADEGPPPAP